MTAGSPSMAKRYFPSKLMQQSTAMATILTAGWLKDGGVQHMPESPAFFMGAH